MEIILRQDLDELGLEGDITKVARGYARNYLIPRGLALEATPQNINILNQQRKKIELKRMKAKDAAESLKKQIEGIELTFNQKAGDEGRLYGSVTSMDIASQLESQGVVIDRKKIVLEQPIKSLGKFKASVRLYPGIAGALTINVVSDNVAPEAEE